MRHGVRLGLDVGTVRIGVAVSDADGILATPLSTVQRSDNDFLAQLATLVRERHIVEVIIGLPLALSGAMTASTQDALSVARDLDALLAVPVRMVDERLTTVSAHIALQQNGKKQKQTRQVIDQVAAVLILQHALETERSQGRHPGTLVAEVLEH